MKTVFKVLVGILLSFFTSAILAVPIVEWFATDYEATLLSIFGFKVALNMIVLSYGIYQKSSFGLTSNLYDVQVEIWVDYILGALFKNNEFLQHAYNADDNVIGGKIVHIPVAGPKPAIVKNRGTFPAVAVRRTDTDILYALDEYTSDPTHITNADQVELSYDKIESVLGEHMATLRERVAEEMLYHWATSPLGTAHTAQIIRTTGASVPATATGATGNRLKFVKEQLKTARKMMNLANIPKEDRYSALPSEFFDQLQDDEDLKKRDFGQELDMKGGVVSRLYGFNLIERSSVLLYDNAGTPVVKAVGAAAATSDNEAALCWQKNAVERALGTVDFFEDIKNPLYYGDIYSALVRMGGRIRRSQGVVAIVQASA